MLHPEVVAIGSVLVDHMLFVQEDYLSTIPGKKGGMEEVDYPQMVSIIEKSGTIPTVASGGSAANFIKGLGKLGHKTAFIGKCGQDPMAQVFLQGLLQAQVTTHLIPCNTPTGHVACLVTPDGKRTCRTFAGASKELSHQDLHQDFFHGAKWVHIEAYQLLNGTVVETAMYRAKEAGAKISFDLSSFELVTSQRERILSLLKQFVDLVFGNQDEAAALFGPDPKATCDNLRKLCSLAVIMMGEKGCLVGSDQVKEIQSFDAFPVKPVDTTGAGDLFESGFIHGLLLGKPLADCARYGALLGQAIVQVPGVELPEATWEVLRGGLF
jgi:sugar/nucleoside kinase (ribokinase family)